MDRPNLKGFQNAAQPNTAAALYSVHQERLHFPCASVHALTSKNTFSPVIRANQYFHGILAHIMRSLHVNDIAVTIAAHAQAATNRLHYASESECGQGFISSLKLYLILFLSLCLRSEERSEGESVLCYSVRDDKNTQVT